MQHDAWMGIACMCEVLASAYANFEERQYDLG
jgi:hypothetical protein